MRIYLSFYSYDDVKSFCIMLFECKSTSMESRNTLDYGESDSHTSVTISSSSFIYFIEFFFYICYFFIWNSDSIIRKYQDKFFLSFIYGDLQCRLFSCIFEEIRKDIMEYLDIHIFIHIDLFFW